MTSFQIVKKSLFLNKPYGEVIPVCLGAIFRQHDSNCDHTVEKNWYRLNKLAKLTVSGLLNDWTISLP